MTVALVWWVSFPTQWELLAISFLQMSMEDEIQLCMEQVYDMWRESVHSYVFHSHNHIITHTHTHIQGKAITKHGCTQNLIMSRACLIICDSSFQYATAWICVWVFKGGSARYHWRKSCKLSSGCVCTSLHTRPKMKVNECWQHFDSLYIKQGRTRQAWGLLYFKKQIRKKCIQLN